MTTMNTETKISNGFYVTGDVVHGRVNLVTGLEFIIAQVKAMDLYDEFVMSDLSQCVLGCTIGKTHNLDSTTCREIIFKFFKVKPRTGRHLMMVLDHVYLDKNWVPRTSKVIGLFTTKYGEYLTVKNWLNIAEPILAELKGENS